MSSGIFDIGKSGLLSSRQQLATTGHNIVNVNTDGYSRQRTELSASTPNYTGAGFIGTGVIIDTTRRYYDEFLEEQIRNSNSQLGKFERFYELVSQIDNILANPDAGLTPTLEAFYNDFQEANDFPSSVPARSVLLSSANTLIDRFELLQERFFDLNAQTNSNLEDVAAEITSRAASIAELNQQIAIQIGKANGNLPNDTLDHRENLIKELSEFVDVSVIYQENGAANIFIGSGQSLVLNTTAFTMSIRDGEYSPLYKEIYLSNNNTDIEVTSQINGGELKGLLDFKEQVLDPAFNSLGRIAASLSKEMNDQHQLGLSLQQDTSGNYILGGDFFTDLTAPQATLASQYNTGTATPTINITDTSVLTISDYELSYDGTNYNMTRLSDGTIFSGATITALNIDLSAAAALPKGPQGISISDPLVGMAAGDKFLIQPTRELSRSIGVEITDELDIALASPIVASEGVDLLGVGTNTGTGQITFIPFEAPNGSLTNIPITDTDPGGNYVNITLTYNGTGFDISAVADPIENVATPIAYDPTTDSGTTLTIGGNYSNISFVMTGTPETGDSFKLSNNTSPQDDNRNGLIMANIQTKKTINNGTIDFQRAYGLLVVDVGTSTHSSEVDLRAQITINEQAVENRDSLSGVNLDEEASNLLRFQQAYQASAKVISVADEIFNSLLNAV